MLCGRSTQRFHACVERRAEPRGTLPFARAQWKTMNTNAAGPVATSGESLRRARSGEGGSAPPTTHAPTSSLKFFSSRELSRNVLARMARISSRQARWSNGGPPRLTRCEGSQKAPPCEGARAQLSWVFAWPRICQHCARRHLTALHHSKNPCEANDFNQQTFPCIEPICRNAQAQRRPLQGLPTASATQERARYDLRRKS